MGRPAGGEFARNEGGRFNNVFVFQERVVESWVSGEVVDRIARDVGFEFAVAIYRYRLVWWFALYYTTRNVAEGGGICRSGMCFTNSFFFLLGFYGWPIMVFRAQRPPSRRLRVISQAEGSPRRAAGPLLWTLNAVSGCRQVM